MSTRAEFVESLRRHKPKVYIHGEKVENLIDHPLFKIPIDNVNAESELTNTETRKYAGKYLKANPDIPAEHSQTHHRNNQRAAIKKRPSYRSVQHQVFKNK